MSRFLSRNKVLAVAVLALGACSDSTSPASVTLTAVSPAPDALAMAPSTIVTLTFDQAMMSGMEQYMDLHQGGIMGATVPMNCAWSTGMTTATCTPMAPLSPGTQYTIHVGCGITDAQGHMIEMERWTHMGGEWATSGMMGGTHAGQPMGMMGPGWSNGPHYGMLFTFTTA